MEKIRRVKMKDTWREDINTGEWAEIPEWSGYFVNKKGQVKSVKVEYNEHFHTKTTKEKMLSSFSDAHGYLRINLSDGERRKMTLVHRLVAQAFIPNPDNKPHINHINGNKQDASAENLEWCTPSENEWHSYHVLGKKTNLVNHAIRKFDDETAEAIRTEHSNGATYEVLAEKYGCNRMTIGQVVRKVKAYGK